MPDRVLHGTVTCVPCSVCFSFCSATQLFQKTKRHSCIGPLIRKNETLLKSQKIIMFIDRAIARPDFICEGLLALWRGTKEFLSPTLLSAACPLQWVRRC